MRGKTGVCLVLCLTLLTPVFSALPASSGSRVDQSLVVYGMEKRVTVSCRGGALSLRGTQPAGSLGRCGAGTALAIVNVTDAIRVELADSVRLNSLSVLSAEASDVALVGSGRLTSALRVLGGNIGVAAKITAASVEFAAARLAVLGDSSRITAPDVSIAGKGLGVLLSDKSVINASGAKGIVARSVRVTGKEIEALGKIVAPSGFVTLESASQGLTAVAGAIDVSNAARGATGGTVHVLGGTVSLANGTAKRSSSAALIDASGAAGGGTVLVGGGREGKGSVPNSVSTVVAKGVKITANALRHGSGGSVVVWSDDLTVFMGAIAARGGRAGGDGGFAEISGHNLTNRGTADVAAPRGKAGRVLIDPLYYAILPFGPFTVLSGVYDLSALLKGEASATIEAHSVKLFCYIVFKCPVPTGPADHEVGFVTKDLLLSQVGGKLAQAKKPSLAKVGKIMKALSWLMLPDTETLEVFSGNFDVKSLVALHMLHGPLNTGQDDDGLNLTKQGAGEKVSFTSGLSLIDFGKIDVAGADLTLRAGAGYSKEELDAAFNDIGTTKEDFGNEAKLNIGTQLAGAVASMFKPSAGDGGADGIKEILGLVNDFCRCIPGFEDSGCFPPGFIDLALFITNPTAHIDLIDDILIAFDIHPPDWMVDFFDIVADVRVYLADFLDPIKLIDYVLGGVSFEFTPAFCVFPPGADEEDCDAWVPAVNVSIPGLCSIDDAIPCTVGEFIELTIGPLIIDGINVVLEKLTGFTLPDIGDLLGIGSIPIPSIPDVNVKPPALLYVNDPLNNPNGKIILKNHSTHANSAVYFNDVLTGSQVAIDLACRSGTGGDCLTDVPAEGKIGARALSFTAGSNYAFDPTIASGSASTAAKILSNNVKLVAGRGIGTSDSRIKLTRASTDATTPIAIEIENGAKGGGVYLLTDLASVLNGSIKNITGSAAGTIDLLANAALTLSSATVENATGGITISAPAALALNSSTVKNTSTSAGAISLAATAGTSALSLVSSTVENAAGGITLSSPGALSLSSSTVKNTNTTAGAISLAATSGTSAVSLLDTTVENAAGGLTITSPGNLSLSGTTALNAKSTSVAAASFSGTLLAALPTVTGSKLTLTGGSGNDVFGGTSNDVNRVHGYSGVPVDINGGDGTDTLRFNPSTYDPVQDVDRNIKVMDGATQVWGTINHSNIETILNVRPTISAVTRTGGTANLKEGTDAWAGTVSFIDWGAQNWNISVDWGDGTTSTTTRARTTAEAATGLLTATLPTHIYKDDEHPGTPRDNTGPYTITVTVTDTQDSGSRAKTTTIDVDNVNPTTVLNKTLAVVMDEGAVFLEKINVARTYSATVTDPGLDEEFFSWSFPATSAVDSPATFSAQCTAPCSDPDNNIPASVTKTATTTYLFPGSYTVRIFGTDDEGGVSNTDSLPVIVTDGRSCTATSSWWLANYSNAQGRQLRDQQLLAYNDMVRFASPVFGPTAKANPVVLKLMSKTDGKTILSATGSRGYAQSAGLAAWLNFAAGGVSLSEPVPSDGRSVRQVLTEIDSILNNPSASATQLQRARTLADKINTMRTKCI